MLKTLIYTYPLNHVIGGVLLQAMLMLKFSAPLALTLVLLAATLRETGQSLHWWPHEDQNWQIAMNDVGHWMLGASLVLIPYLFLK